MRIRRPEQGFTLVEIMLVVAIIGLLTTLALPASIKARTRAQTTACINNLRQIDAAKEQWAMASLAGTGSVDEAAVNEYIKDGAPGCPGGGSYGYGELGHSPVCSIAVHTF
jgi:prepilin-type N-terminal cleavage/methylation domain-containing protein